MARCKFCGGGAGRAGQPCSISPTGYHVVYEPNRCIYCGGCGRAGGPCACGPHGRHVVDAGPSRCIYCGGFVCSVVAATQCSCSPTGHCHGLWSTWPRNPRRQIQRSFQGRSTGFHCPHCISAIGCRSELRLLSQEDERHQKEARTCDYGWSRVSG